MKNLVLPGMAAVMLLSSGSAKAAEPTTPGVLYIAVLPSKLGNVRSGLGLAMILATEKMRAERCEFIGSPYLAMLPDQYFGTPLSNRISELYQGEIVSRYPTVDEFKKLPTAAIGLARINCVSRLPVAIHVAVDPTPVPQFAFEQKVTISTVIGNGLDSRNTYVGKAMAPMGEVTEVSSYPQFKLNYRDYVKFIPK